MVDYAELIRNAAAAAHLDAEQLRAYIDAYFAEILRNLCEGKDVNLHESFGRIVVRERAAKVSDTCITRRHYMPIYKESSQLRKLLTQSDADYIMALRQSGFFKQADNIEKQLKAKNPNN